MSSVANHQANGTPTTANGRLSGSPAKAIECRQHKAWYVGDKKIIEENRSGRFTIPDNIFLDWDALRRLHAVLSKLLADEEASVREALADAEF